MSDGEGYEFVGGYPTPDTVQRTYDEADLNRAVQTYRLFFPTVSGLAIFKGTNVLGVIENEVFGTLETKPMHVGLTLNADTPYAPLLLDLSSGPMVIELPPGPLICIAMDSTSAGSWTWDCRAPTPAREAATCCSRPATRARFPTGGHLPSSHDRAPRRTSLSAPMRRCSRWLNSP